MAEPNEDVKMPETDNNETPEDSGSPEANPSVFTTHEMSVLDKYKKTFYINIHPTERKWQCAVWVKGDTSHEWFGMDLSSNISFVSKISSSQPSLWEIQTDA